jgi:hypothetical protein
MIKGYALPGPIVVQEDGLAILRLSVIEYHTGEYRETRNQHGLCRGWLRSYRRECWV